MVQVKKHAFQEESLPETVYSKDYMVELMEIPMLTRNVAFLGQLHHGKTTMIDRLVEQAHAVDFVDNENGARGGTCNVRFADTLMTEQARGMSIKSTPLSLLLPDCNSKNWLVNIFDTPGRPLFTVQRSELHLIYICWHCQLLVDVVCHLLTLSVAC